MTPSPATLMEPDTKTEVNALNRGSGPASDSGHEAEVRRLIAQARSRIERPDDEIENPVSAGWGLLSMSAVLMWATFAPLDQGYLGWLALVPVLWLVQRPRWSKRTILAAYVTSLVSQLASLQWMRLGDPTMYVAWVALAAYIACYLPVFLLLSRLAVHRWKVPLVVAAPVIWVALEFVKAHLFTGFAWYLMGHSQYRWLEMIQISDLGGAYLVSFVVVTGACAIMMAVARLWGTWLSRRKSAAQAATSIEWAMGKSAVVQILAASVLISASLGYGYLRRSQANFTPGPKMALIQGNYPASLVARADDSAPIFVTHMRMTGMSVAHRPDVIVWPETMFRWPLFDVPADWTDEKLKSLRNGPPIAAWRDQTIRKTLAGEAQKAGAALILGLESIVPSEEKILRHNSAAFVRPDLGVMGRYDKIHLVPFGEYLPLSQTIPALKFFLPPEMRNSFGLDDGKSAAVFEYGKWRMVPVICFEDTVPHLVRDIVGSVSEKEQGRQVDVLVNLSNDGWFHGSSELEQHLITAAFRAVETRTPLVRAVNTGISAFIDGDGAILEPEVYLDGDRLGRTSPRDPKTGAWLKQVNSAQIRTVPLDDRTSFYVQYGDWFTALCGLLVGILLTAEFVSRCQTWRQQKA
ncbi:apolipoprotein N-acyltransferase [Planctopirus hydrillae]|uniref:Apolipoprotein N-acyltransferase n=1 Tax=Planctopirus hydrillae TaxID=1841610 RepID=A0A1C3EKC8_9PLAN|nr:apolipoprotein N-acyltransferase [Planctopirus hydrillae]ODA33679.1 apolipoprotein N-acyltransferase [Planctopirus hydrillae]